MSAQNLQKGYKMGGPEAPGALGSKGSVAVLRTSINQDSRFPEEHISDSFIINIHCMDFKVALPKYLVSV